MWQASRSGFLTVAFLEAGKSTEPEAGFHDKRDKNDLGGSNRKVWRRPTLPFRPTNRRQCKRKPASDRSAMKAALSPQRGKAAAVHRSRQQGECLIGKLRHFRRGHNPRDHGQGPPTNPIRRPATTATPTATKPAASAQLNQPCEWAHRDIVIAGGIQWTGRLDNGDVSNVGHGAGPPERCGALPAVEHTYSSVSGLVIAIRGSSTNDSTAAKLNQET